jgi:hypothetical protein
MTRGTAYLILRDKIICTDEFNGDMYGSPKDSEELQREGHYPEMMERLKRVKSEGEFIKELIAFSDGEDYAFPTRFHDCYMKNIDLSVDYIDRFHSDFLFFKNLSGRTVTIIDDKKRPIKLKNGLTATFHYGEFIEIA